MNTTTSICKTLRGALLAAALLLAQKVGAVPIDGTIDFTGGVRVTQGGTTATVDFFDGTTFVDGSPYTSDPTGHYAGIAAGTAALFADFTFDTGSLVLNPLSVNVWTVNSGGLTYTFTLDHLSSAVLAHPQNGTMIQGTGVANITGGASGFSATPGAFILAGSGTNTLFRFSSGTAVSSSGGGAAVPDGGSAVALLGIAMIGVEGLRRKLLMA